MNLGFRQATIGLSNPSVEQVVAVIEQYAQLGWSVATPIYVKDGIVLILEKPKSITNMHSLAVV